MIYDKLENLEQYYGLSRWLDKALEFLESTDLDSLPNGRIEISGDKVFANVMDAAAKDEAEGKFEIHKKYMDIQIDISGTEMIQIGLDVQGEIDTFEEEKDFGTVDCASAASCIMGKGRFIICMGQEPHKPGIAVGEDRKLRKCVVKVSTT